MNILEDDISHPKVLELLSEHMSGMQENTPPEHVHALDVSGLKVPEIKFWTVWENETLMGCGALKQLSETSHFGSPHRTCPASPVSSQTL